MQFNFSCPMSVLANAIRHGMPEVDGVPCERRFYLPEIAENLCAERCDKMKGLKAKQRCHVP